MSQQGGRVAADDGDQVPVSLHDEQCLVASLVAAPESFHAVSGNLSDDDFADEACRETYRLISKIVAAGDLPTRAMVLSEAGRSGIDQHVTKQIVGVIGSGLSDPANIQAHLRRVKEHAADRKMDALLSSVHIQLINRAGDPADRLALLTEGVAGIAAKLHISNRRGHVAESSTEALEDSVARRDGLSGSMGVRTGYRDLDEILNPFQPANVIILAGRPSMGKSALAMGIAENIATAHLVRHGADRVTVVVFSYEMTRDQIAARILSSKAKVPSVHIVRGSLSPSEESACRDVITAMNDIDIVLIDDTSLTPARVRSILLEERDRARARGSRLGLAILDYLQLMPSDRGQGRGGERQEEVASISRGLKLMANDPQLKIPILALSQLNRKLEGRQDPRPALHDLRESGAIEQDADTVIFVHNEYVRSHNPADRGRVEIIIAKQRSGPLGACTLSFDDQFVRFGNYVNTHCVTSHYPSLGPGSRDYFGAAGAGDAAPIDPALNPFLSAGAANARVDDGDLIPLPGSPESESTRVDDMVGGTMDYAGMAPEAASPEAVSPGADLGGLTDESPAKPSARRRPRAPRT